MDTPGEAQLLREKLARAELELEALKRERELMEQFCENAPVAIEIYDAEGFALRVNRAMRQFLGMANAEDAIGKFNVRTDPFIAASGMRESFERAYAGEVVTMPELRVDLSSADSQWNLGSDEIWFEQVLLPIRDAQGGVRAVVAFARDVSERRKMQDMVAHAQRQSSLALLAGSVAHDFNNTPGAILGNASLAKSPTASPKDVEVALEHVCRAAEHAANLTRQLLAYAGKGRFAMRPVDLSSLAHEITRLLEVSLPKKAELRFDLDCPDQRVLGDETQLRQVVMNLVTNAGEALGDGPGTITVATRVIELDAAWLAAAHGAPDLKPGRYVALEVTDTGVGMSAEVHDRVFDPFFTTKQRGAGLGLAAVLGIVTGHGGALRIFSRPGLGSRVMVVFPPTQAAASEHPPTPQPQPAASGAARTVLVVDDEPLVRMMAAHALELAGYEVLKAAHGKEAVELYDQHAARVSLVLLDLAMPVMDGAEAMKELRQRNPNLPILMTSGYDEDDTVSRLSGQKLTGFIHKPYRAELLLDCVRRALNENAPR